jgi:preprotein translocase subunit SecD
MQESRKSFQPKGSGRSYGEQSFQMFLETADLKSIIDGIDSEGSADASGIKTPPEITFKAQVSVMSNGKGRPDEQVVMLLISDQDASKLKGITENNWGKRMLIVSRNKAIAAPSISQPLSSRSVMFPVKDANVLSNLFNH